MLTLSRLLATRLLKHAQSSPDRRIGGVLLARDGIAENFQPLTNQASDTRHAQQFDAAQYQAVVSEAEAQGLSPMALYYSHPDCPPVPDAADLTSLPSSELPLLVISLNTKGVLEMRAFITDDAKLSETPVQIFS